MISTSDMRAQKCMKLSNVMSAKLKQLIPVYIATAKWVMDSLQGFEAIVACIFRPTATAGSVLSSIGRLQVNAIPGVE